MVSIFNIFQTVDCGTRLLNVIRAANYNNLV